MLFTVIYTEKKEILEDIFDKLISNIVAQIERLEKRNKFAVARKSGHNWQPLIISSAINFVVFSGVIFDAIFRSLITQCSLVGINKQIM